MDFWTVNEVADAAKVDHSYIRMEIYDGHLPATKRAGIWIIQDEDALTWLHEREERVKKGVRRKYKPREK